MEKGIFLKFDVEGCHYDVKYEREVYIIYRDGKLVESCNHMDSLQAIKMMIGVFANHLKISNYKYI